MGRLDAIPWNMERLSCILIALVAMAVIKVCYSMLYLKKTLHNYFIPHLGLLLLRSSDNFVMFSLQFSFWTSSLTFLSGIRSRPAMTRVGAEC